VNVAPIESVVGSYKGRLSIEPVSKTSSVVALTVSDPVQDKAVDF